MIYLKRKLKNFGPLEFLVLSSLFYAVLINPKENKYQLISDVNGKIKCVLN